MDNTADNPKPIQMTRKQALGYAGAIFGAGAISLATGGLHVATTIEGKRQLIQATDLALTRSGIEASLAPAAQSLQAQGLRLPDSLDQIYTVAKKFREVQVDQENGDTYWRGTDAFNANQFFGTEARAANLKKSEGKAPQIDSPHFPLISGTSRNEGIRPYFIGKFPAAEATPGAPEKVIFGQEPVRTFLGVKARMIKSLASGLFGEYAPLLVHKISTAIGTGEATSVDPRTGEIVMGSGDQLIPFDHVTAQITKLVLNLNGGVTGLSKEWEPMKALPLELFRQTAEALPKIIDYLDKNPALYQAPGAEGLMQSIMLSLRDPKDYKFYGGQENYDFVMKNCPYFADMPNSDLSQLESKRAEFFKTYRTVISQNEKLKDTDFARAVEWEYYGLVENVIANNMAGMLRGDIPLQSQDPISVLNTNIQKVLGAKSIPQLRNELASASIGVTLGYIKNFDTTYSTNILSKVKDRVRELTTPPLPGVKVRSDDEWGDEVAKLTTVNSVSDPVSARIVYELGKLATASSLVKLPEGKRYLDLLTQFS